MSTKSSLKNRIKKANATQAFFNSYDTNEDTDKDKNKNEENNEIITNNNDDINNKNNDNIDNETYVKNNNVIDNVVNDTNDIQSDDVLNAKYDDSIKNNIKTILNIDDKPDDSDNDIDYLRELALGKKPKNRKAKKVFTSFYMDPDLAIEVDKIASRGEKGDKSKLINTGIRRLLEDYGVIDSKKHL